MLVFRAALTLNDHDRLLKSSNQHHVHAREVEPPRMDSYGCHARLRLWETIRSTDACSCCGEPRAGFGSRPVSLYVHQKPCLRQKNSACSITGVFDSPVSLIATGGSNGPFEAHKSSLVHRSPLSDVRISVLLSCRVTSETSVRVCSVLARFLPNKVGQSWQHHDSPVWRRSNN